MLFEPTLTVLLVNTSVVARNTNVSLASCNVHVRAAVTVPASELVNPLFVRLCGNGSVVDPVKVLVPVKVLLAATCAFPVPETVAVNGPEGVIPEPETVYL